MQLVIPHAPREVRLAQVPGALARVVTAALVGAVLTACAGVAAVHALRWAAAERAFVAKGLSLTGEVTTLEGGTDGHARLGAAWTVAGRRYAASELTLGTDSTVPMAGGPVALYVDPEDPSRARERTYAVARAQRAKAVPFAVAGALALAIALWAVAVVRAVRREVVPLRKGSLVWLTPDRPLPVTRGGRVVRASYFREDVKHAVRARVWPSRRPVRKDEKVLAAVLDSQPDWGLVVDEELLARLGWSR